MTQGWIIAMADADYRKELGTRIKALRKERGLSQKELAALAGLTFGQLNKYESGLNYPSPESLIRLAKELSTTLDVLMTGNQPGEVPIENLRLLERLKELEHVGTEDQEAVIKIIDAVIIKNRAAGVLSPIDQ
jgi:transcriptional regulator with XRE-family HTH domain